MRWIHAEYVGLLYSVLTTCCVIRITKESVGGDQQPVLIMAPLDEAAEMGDIGACTEKRLVVDERLCFVAYKLNWMAPDTIIQLCSSFYSDEAVDNEKDHL